MSYQCQLREQPAQPTLSIRTRTSVQGLPQLIGRLAERARAQRAAAELRALTDRELADIGLTRGDIANVVAGRLRRAG